MLLESTNGHCAESPSPGPTIVAGRWQTIQNRIDIINSSPVTVADTKHQNLYNIAQNPFISGHFGNGGRESGAMQTTY